MDSDELVQIRQRLDRELEGRNECVGIAFGLELYSEFINNDLITLEENGLASFGIDDPAPAYRRTHFAFAMFGLLDREFRIGRDAL